MMSTESIVAMSRAAAVRAAAYQIEPYAPDSIAEVESYGDGRHPFPFPNLGQYRPSDWTMVEYVLADSSGFGRYDEPALTIDALRQWVINWMTIDPTVGFALVEAGEFQVVVAAFSQADDAEPCEGCDGDNTFSDVSWFDCPDCGEPVEDGEEECYVCGWYKADEEDEEDEDEPDEDYAAAYQKGREAFDDGVPVTDNPYLPFTQENGAWSNGFGDAKSDHVDTILAHGQQEFDTGE